jgi:hypothetical protein
LKVHDTNQKVIEHKFIIEAYQDMKLETGQYYGNIFQAVNTNGVILTRTDYSGKVLLPVHYHENPYFCLY